MLPRNRPVLPVKIDSREDCIAHIDSRGWHRASGSAEEKIHDLIACVSVGAGLDWWLTSPPSRNVFVSPLYRNLRIICYFDDVCRQGGEIEFREVIVDSPALRQIIDNMFIGYGLLGIKVTCINNYSKLYSTLSLIRNVLGHLLRYSIFGFPRLKITNKIRIDVLVDLFILSGWQYGDRYYGGVISHLSKKDRKTVWLVPEFLSSSLSELRKQKDLLLTSGEVYLFKESVLTLSDYYFAIRKTIGQPYVPALKSASCSGLPVHTLIKEEMTRLTGFDQTVRGWLNYQFFKRISALGLKPKRIIDWFENQSIDKGWHKGVNEFFPDSYSIGYQGFSDVPSYFCMFATEAEKKAGVLPKEIAVMGDGYVQSRRRYCTKLKVVAAPAFRFEHLWRGLGDALSKRKVALVCLPIDNTVATDLLQCVLSHSQQFWDSLGLELRIRLHPACPLSSLKLPAPTVLYIEGLIDSGPFIDAVDSSRIFIGTMSSTCLEALVRHVPVIIFQVAGNDFNTIPSDSPECMVAFFSNDIEFEEIVCHFSSDAQAISESVSDEIYALRKRYFSPINDDSVNDFFRPKWATYE